MPAPNLLGASDDVYALLATDAAPIGTPETALTAVGIKKIFDHEPKAGDSYKGLVVTVAPMGMDANDYMVAVRVYSSVQVDARQSQRALVTALQVVDTLLDDSYGPSEWEVSFDSDVSAFVATIILSRGREDF